MRLLFLVLFLAATVETTRADEARLAPAAGSKLTYRMIAKTTTSAGRTTISGRVYTYTFGSSDGVAAEGTIKLDAMLFDCKGRDDEPFCGRVLKAAGAKTDGDLVLVPVPDDLAQSLAKDSVFKVRYFVVEKRVSALPAVTSAGDALFNGEDPLVTTNVMDCDPEPMNALPPRGDAQHATLACRAAFSRSGWAAQGSKPATSTDAVKLDVVDFGVSSIALPSGTWDARRLKLTLTSNSGANNMEGEARFSEKLGVAVQTRWTSASANGETMTEFVSELIAASP
jgi:hypothetical protein